MIVIDNVNKTDVRATVLGLNVNPSCCLITFASAVFGVFFCAHTVSHIMFSARVAVSHKMSAKLAADEEQVDKCQRHRRLV